MIDSTSFAQDVAAEKAAINMSFFPGFLELLVGLLTALMSMKKNPEKKAQAVALGALAGYGTHVLATETNLLPSFLQEMATGTPVPPPAAIPITREVTYTAPDGTVTTTTETVPNVATLPDNTVTPRASTSVPISLPITQPSGSVTPAGTTSGVANWLSQLSPNQIAAGVGAVGVATGAIDVSKWLPLAGIALAAFLLLKG